MKLCEVGELTNCPPGTEAKFMTKSRSLKLLPNRITSAETKARICTAADCFNVEPQLHKTFCCLLALLVSHCLYFCRTHFNLRFPFKIFSINVSPLKVNALLTSVPQIEGIELVIRLCVTTFAVSSIM